MPTDHKPGKTKSPILVVGRPGQHSTGLDLSSIDAVVIGAEEPDLPAGWESARAEDIKAYRPPDATFVAAAEEANSLINDWANASTSSGRTLEEVTEHLGASLWQAVEFNLLYGYLAGWVDELQLWHRVFEVEQPSEIVLLPGETSNAPELLASARGIPVRKVGGGAVRDGGRPRAGWEHLPHSLASRLRRYRSRVRSSHAHRFNRGHEGWSQPGEGTAGIARRIVVLTVVRRFAEVSIPVIKALVQDRYNQVLVIDKNTSTAVPRLEEESIPYRLLEGYADGRSRAIYREEQRRYVRAWRRLEKDVPFQGQLVWRGIGLWPVLRPVLRQYFDALFPELARVIAVTRNLLRDERPDVCVVTDERPPFQRAFVAACRLEGVPTVGIQDTLFPDLPYGSPISTDWLAVEGEVARENLTKRGTSSNKLVVTGQPRFDFLASLDAESRQAQVRNALDLDPEGKTILVVSQYAGIYFRATDKRRIFKAIYEALARIPDLQVIVKLHPDEADGSIERELAEQAGLSRCLVVETGDIMDYLLASDLVIVFFSTVGHEAILLGKPLIQIPVGNGEGTIIPFTEEGGALDGANLENLEELVRAALFDSLVRQELREGRQAYIDRHVHALDGRAAERVAELVVNATERGRE